MTTIDQQTFEKYVPAFASADSSTFERMLPYIETMTRAVEEREVKTDGLAEPLLSAIERYVCVAAARKAAPQLDLVLTANGFGVVSNQNVAPASRDRVNALIERLRIDESEAFDMLLTELLKTDWSKSATAESYITSLLYMPSLMRRYGIKDEEGREVYYQEWQQLQNELAVAEEKVRMLISPELFDKLIEVQRIPATEHPHEYNIVLEQARKAVAAHISARRYPSAPKALCHRLLDTIKRYAEALTEYNTSSTYQAHNTQPYENRKEDGAYFFG